MPVGVELGLKDFSCHLAPARYWAKTVPTLLNGSLASMSFFRNFLSSFCSILNQPRLLSRPFQADSFLKDVILEFVEKPHSVSRLIANSPHIQELYADFRAKTREKVKISKDIRDMAFAPQRYASESKVLARLTLTWDAVLGVLTTLPQWRGAGSIEGTSCLATLRFLSAERLIQLGMMADAAIELHRLVETLDADDFEECDLCSTLERYQEIIRKLFVEGMCLQVPGCTKIMLMHLSEERAINCCGVAVQLGGARDEGAIAACLTRMSNYVFLMEQVLQAEFPSWELMSAFSVFSLEKMNKRKRVQADDAEKTKALEQLAQAVHVDFEDLKHQFEHFEPIAHKFFSKHGSSTFSAWKQAIQATTKSRRVHCVSALLPVLSRLGAWSSSSSGVERGFAKAQACKQQGQSQDENPFPEEQFLLLQDFLHSPGATDSSMKALCHEASKVWRSLCGLVRCSGSTKRKERWDAGLPRTE